MKHPNRETWLLAATEALRSGLFREHGQEVPNVRVSVGFPGGGSARKRIGEYWSAGACSDKIPQIFISPVLSTGFEAIDTLTHELVHACTPGSGHKGPFRKLALAIGMEGPMRSAGAGPVLKERLNALLLELGEYPHASVNLADRKKQTTRMLKCECSDCGYTVRTAQKWLDAMGPPLCACNGEPMKAASQEGGDA